ncbi:MAG TPA: hypothetical protein VGF99_13950 [Myxococcota bacterium]
MLIDVSSLVRRPAHRQRLLRDEASSSSTTGPTSTLAPVPRFADSDDDDANDDPDPDATTEDEPVSDAPVIVTWCD